MILSDYPEILGKRLNPNYFSREMRKNE